jgi:hypothetical protein
MTFKELSTKIANVLALSGRVAYKLLLLYALYFIGTQLSAIAQLMGYALMK